MGLCCDLLLERIGFRRIHAMLVSTRMPPPPPPPALGSTWIWWSRGRSFAQRFPGSSTWVPPTQKKKWLPVFLLQHQVNKHTCSCRLFLSKPQDARRFPFGFLNKPPGPEQRRTSGPLAPRRLGSARSAAGFKSSHSKVSHASGDSTVSRVSSFSSFERVLRLLLFLEETCLGCENPKNLF